MKRLLATLTISLIAAGLIIARSDITITSFTAETGARIERATLSPKMSIQAARRGSPWMNLSDGRDLVTAYTGPAELVRELEQNRARPLALASADYPSFDAMRGGVGTIRLRAVAPLVTAAGPHRLHYRNNHRQDASVYLVNALVPSAPDISLGAPRRDPLQQAFDIDYVQDRAARSPDPRTGWRWPAAIALALVAVGVRRRRRRTPAARL